MALPNLTLSDATREKLRAALVTARHALFWTEWALRLLFVGPAICLCLALALSSHFSFERLAGDTLQVIASMERGPAPPADGFVTMEICKDPAPQVPGRVPNPPAVCKIPGWEQISISDAASTVGKTVWSLYGMGVMLTIAFCFTMGSFDGSRRVFRASLEGALQGIPVAGSVAGATK
jgi:hypothetical protein